MLVAAVIALAIALAAAVGGLIAIALKAIGAERRAGDEKSGHAETSVRLETMTEKWNDAVSRADREKERGDALDDLLAETAVAGLSAAAWDGMLQAWHALRAARGDGARAVPAPSGPSNPGPDDLLPLE